MRKQVLIKTHKRIWALHRETIPQELLDAHEEALKKAFFSGAVWATAVINEQSDRLQVSAMRIVSRAVVGAE